MNYIQISWTSGNLDEAKQIARALVEQKLVACAQMMPIESIFLWKNKLDTAQEIKVIFKTKDHLFDSIKNYILQHAKYEVPEILKTPILDGNASYLKWLDDSVMT